MLSLVRRLIGDTTGATAIEYGLIVGILSLTIVGGVGLLSNELQAMWTATSDTFNSSWTFD